MFSIDGITLKVLYFVRLDRAKLVIKEVPYRDCSLVSPLGVYNPRYRMRVLIEDDYLEIFEDKVRNRTTCTLVTPFGTHSVKITNINYTRSPIPRYHVLDLEMIDTEIP